MTHEPAAYLKIAVSSVIVAVDVRGIGLGRLGRGCKGAASNARELRNPPGISIYVYYSQSESYESIYRISYGGVVG